MSRDKKKILPSFLEGLVGGRVTKQVRRKVEVKEKEAREVVIYYVEEELVGGLLNKFRSKVEVKEKDVRELCTFKNCVLQHTMKPAVVCQREE